MKANQSAGILLFRRSGGQVEFLLVHPGGPYHAKKDIGNWSIPKGLFEEGEQSIDAARREFQEELGQELKAEKLFALTPVRQKSGKTVHAWAAEGDIDIDNIRSNTFRMEYPYRSGKWVEVPEIDQAVWFSPELARKKINSAQVAFIDELLQMLEAEATSK